MGRINVIDIGLIEYIKAYEFQRKKAEEVVSGLSENCVVLAEHPPVITIGRTGTYKNILCDREELLRRQISVCDSDRGGDVTYHCPGQLIVYPIVRLEKKAFQIHIFLRFLEEVCVKFLNRFGIFSYRTDNLTGVWIDNKKIVSIGIGIKRWVTYHGMAININNNTEEFSLINPCGIKNLKMASLKEELGFEIDICKAKNVLAEVFIEIYENCFSKEGIPALA